MRGFTVADLDKFTWGMLVNYARAYDRQQRIANGEDVPDVEAQYKKLKAIEPIVEQRFANGEIGESEYNEFKQSILDFERG